MKTRPTFDIVADQILGEPTSWKPSIDLDEGENSLSQIAAKRIGEMRERQEIEEGEEELLGESFGMLKDGRPIWAEVLDTQRGYSTNFTDYGMKDLAFRPLWPPFRNSQTIIPGKVGMLLKKTHVHQWPVKR